MCFYIQKGNTKRLTAEKSIICYKTVTPMYDGEDMNEYCSKYQWFDYKLNKLYKGDLKISLPRNQIEMGFHSYTNSKIAKNHCGSNEVVVECVIPKGAKYYVNTYHEEYVSNQIKIKRVL